MNFTRQLRFPFHLICGHPVLERSRCAPCLIILSPMILSPVNLSWIAFRLLTFPILLLTLQNWSLFVSTIILLLLKFFILPQPTMQKMFFLPAEQWFRDGMMFWLPIPGNVLMGCWIVTRRSRL